MVQELPAEEEAETDVRQAIQEVRIRPEDSGQFYYRMGPPTRIPNKNLDYRHPDCCYPRCTGFGGPDEVSQSRGLCRAGWNTAETSSPSEYFGYVPLRAPYSSWEKQAREGHQDSRREGAWPRLGSPVHTAELTAPLRPYYPE